MDGLLRELRSQIRYQIIGPFLILTVLVAVVGSFIVFSQIAGNFQERFDNQLASVTRAANDALRDQEESNLQFLREVVFAQRNAATNAPGVPEALVNNDREGLQRALDPFFRRAINSGGSGINLDRLIVFDLKGDTLSDLEVPPPNLDAEYLANSSTNILSVEFVRQVINGELNAQGDDKFAGWIQFEEKLYFATVSPIRNGSTVVGGAIAAIQINELLVSVKDKAQAAGINLYTNSGEFTTSTFVVKDEEKKSIPDDILTTLRKNTDATSSSIFNKQTIGVRDYQFAFVPFVVQGVSIGILAPALSSDYVVTTGQETIWPLMFVIFAMTLVIFSAGVFIAHRLTAPIAELVRTAEAIMAGDSSRRANVTTQNEIGTLAKSFNLMTTYLTDLYGKVSTESSQRAAIVESIGDGIVVCDIEERIILVNHTTRRFLDLSDDMPLPTWFSEIPLQKLTDGAMGFGSQRAQDLFTLHERIVRVSANEVVADSGEVMGSVCVLQDMTAEVAVDRAKTNFIGTISHELRTPLTVIRGNADLLMRGLAGPLEDDQKIFVESIRQHASNMTSLIGNVIVIAGLDSGSLATDISPLTLPRPIDEASWPLQSMIKAKGLTLRVELPHDLTEIEVLADFDQLRMIFSQLIDNARRYTSQGEIVIRARALPEYLQIEVADTGRGIPADMHEQIFERFIRGDGTSEGINSSERGIGLGLAICKQLVERQGGTIWVESTPGEGSIFFFTLRYAHATPSPEESTTSLAAAA